MQLDGVRALPKLGSPTLEEQKAKDDRESLELDSKEPQQMIYEADACVVTIPMGVLKNKDVGFEPSLPEWKQKAIDTIGYGILNKVYLKFKKVFWSVDTDYIGYASKTHGEFYLFVNCVPVTGAPILMSLISGEFAVKLEEKPDEAIVKEAMDVLTKIYKSKATAPVNSLVTRWKSDKYARGSYCYVSADCEGGKCYDELARSVDNKVFWAGEGTVRVE